MLLIIFNIGCSYDCSDDIYQEIISPNQKHSATIFERDCGATTDYSQIVVISVMGKKVNLNDINNYVFTMKGDSKINASWKSNKNIEVVRPNKSYQIYTQKNNWNKIDITYSTQ